MKPWLERREGAGRPPRVDRRAIVNALFYKARTGCPWRLLPTDFPPWQTVRYYAVIGSSPALIGSFGWRACKP